MNGGPQDLEVFNLALHIELHREHDFRARAVFRGPGMTAALTIWPSRDALRNLLEQIERQYHDFSHVVSWRTGSADKSLELGWSLTSLGHVDAGHAALVDRVSRWEAKGTLRGDQSYLPRIAMGLQLLLRS